ncbi:MAG TPA: hypothetical protein VGP33_09080 [Chloroflexota bacterium]|jgi:predicted ATPase|nr:hypothetical protein [Chloroflexota bacterium]
MDVLDLPHVVDFQHVVSLERDGAAVLGRQQAGPLHGGSLAGDERGVSGQAERLAAVEDSLHELPDRLDESFRLPTAGSCTALPRQQTLSATIDWSYQLLVDPVRALFRRLAVFLGGWTLEAAEAVCAGDGEERADVADLLARLVDKSVVTAMPGAGESTRYRLLEMLGEYAGKCLVASGEADAVRRRQARYYVALPERAKLPGPRYSQWVMRLDAERGNVRGAFGWLRAGRR